MVLKVYGALSYVATAEQEMKSNTFLENILEFLYFGKDEVNDENTVDGGIEIWRKEDKLK